MSKSAPKKPRGRAGRQIPVEDYEVPDFDQHAQLSGLYANLVLRGGYNDAVVSDVMRMLLHRTDLMLPTHSRAVVALSAYRQKKAKLQAEAAAAAAAQASGAPEPTNIVNGSSSSTSNSSSNSSSSSTSSSIIGRKRKRYGHEPAKPVCVQPWALPPAPDKPICVQPLALPLASRSRRALRIAGLLEQSRQRCELCVCLTNLPILRLSLLSLAMSFVLCLFCAHFFPLFFLTAAPSKGSTARCSARTRCCSCPRTACCPTPSPGPRPYA